MLFAAVWVFTACSGSPPPADGQKSDTGRPGCAIPDASLRRPISANNPHFIFNIYGGPEEVRGVAAVLPEDVRPFFALQYVPPEPYDDSQSFRKNVKAVLDAAEEVGLPTFVQTEHCYTRNETPQSYWSELFARYPSLIGLVFAETSCTGLQLNGLDDGYIGR